MKIQRNDANYSGAYSMSYARNSSNNIQHNRSYMIAHFNGSTDDFRVQVRRDSGGGSPAGTWDDTVIKVVQLSEGGTASLPYAHYGTPATQSGHTNSWTQVTGLDVITESDTSVIQIGGGNLIELKEANRPYLFVYGWVNSDTGAGRTTRLARALHNGDPINNSYGYAYQRNAADQYGDIAGMGLVRPGTANQDLDFEIIGYTGTHWGVWDTGSWALSTASGEAGAMVIALPSTVDMAVFEDETGNQTISGSTIVDLNYARTTVGTADSPFSQTSNTAVDVTSATDVLAHAAMHVDRTTANGTRWTGGLLWEIEGVDDAESEGIDYERGDQGSDDCKDAVVTATSLGSVSANDTFNLEKTSPASNDGGGTMQTVVVGSFFIDLSTLAAGTDATATPAATATSVTVPAPTVTGGTGTTETPATVAASVTIPQATAVTESGTVVTPATIAMSATIPQAGAGVVVNGGVIAMSTTIYDDAILQVHCTVQVDRIWLELHLPDATAQPVGGTPM